MPLKAHYRRFRLLSIANQGTSTFPSVVTLIPDVGCSSMPQLRSAADDAAIEFLAIMIKRLLCSIALFLTAISPVSMHAWGCEGHQIVALIAMKHLQPQVATQVNSILSASPVAAALRHFCRASGLPPMVEVASWADDVRAEQPDTGPLHYINIPLNATRNKYDISELCK